jgi:hypothetical protein
MTETPPIAVLMLSSSTQRAQCRQWLTTDSPWPGTVLEEDLAGLDLMGTGDGDPATAPDSPDVVLLDQAIYDARWPQLQARWPSPRPAFALLLADEDESLAQTAIAAGIDDYLIDIAVDGHPPAADPQAAGAADPMAADSGSWQGAGYGGFYGWRCRYGGGRAIAHGSSSASQ